MKDYLLIFERLLIGAAFFLLAWFWQGSRKPDCIKETFYHTDTLRLNNYIKEKQTVINHYITKTDSLKQVILHDTVYKENPIQSELINIQDTIIAGQGVIIDTLITNNKKLVAEIDTCKQVNINLNKSSDKKIRNFRNALLGVSGILIGLIINNIISY